MALVKTVRLNIVTDPGDSRLKLDAIDEKARKLGTLNPEIKVQIDTMAANLKLAVIREELKRIGTGPDTTSSSSKWGQFKSALSGIIGTAGTSASGAGGSGLLGITTTLPVIGTVGLPALAGLTLAAAALAAALGPVVAALIPVTLGFGTLAAVAGPEVIKVFTALGEHGKKLQATLKTLTPAERDLLKQAEPLKDQFQKLGKAVQPEIMKAFAEGIKIIKELMPALEPLVKAAAKAIDTFLKQMADWLKSPGGQHFIRWLETVGPQDIKNFGRVMWDIANGIGNALYYIYKAGSWIDRFLTHWHDNWVLVKDTAELQFDQIKISVFKLIYDILNAFTRIPIIGSQFKRARDAIGVEMGRIVDDQRRSINEIQAAWNDLHGKKVSIEFTTAFVASHGVPVAPGGHAKGTPAAAPGWAWVGEKGAELVKFTGGETVIPHHLSRQVARGYAAGTGWDITDFFDPRVATAIRRINAGVGAAENRAAGFVQEHPFRYWKFGPNFGGIAGPGGGAPGANAALAMLMYASRMRPGDWAAWNYVAMRESGWNQFATNPSSGAYGIPQALPFSKMPKAAWPSWAGGSSNPAAQISWMWNYMAGVYGGPQGAARHEAAFNWYDQGGWLPPGISIAANGTGRPERVGGGDVHIHLNVQVGHGTNPRQAAKEIADILNQGATSGVRLRKSILSANG